MYNSCIIKSLPGGNSPRGSLSDLDLFPKSIHDLVDSLHVLGINLVRLVPRLGELLRADIHRRLVIPARRTQRIHRLPPHVGLLLLGHRHLDEWRDAADGEQALLRARVVLDGGANAPSGHPAQLALVALQLVEQRRPQAEVGDVVGVVKALDELLEVIECDELVADGDGVAERRRDDLHGGLHEVRVRGPAHERGHYFGREVARAVGARLLRRGGFIVGGVGVFDAPAQEVVKTLVTHGCVLV
ncbi:hypothetical protein TCAP_05096 [Tolypocladium capitatum]|uniref:Uncharacterized protein n=1 Tax=Tolypocladium capitatum TaxID=45235 RepID=A0A2K3QBQ4_9HYPO|nr:hypothetical protein TCAP_05096 [Tolypocladium capitatum]